MNSAYLIFLGVIVCSFPVYSLSLGISPNSISFDKSEQKVMLINPSAYTLQYKITGCNYDFLDVLREGSINPKEKRLLTLQYNPSLNENTSNCTTFISTGNTMYGTGLGLKIYFPESSTTSVTDLDYLFESEQEKNRNYTPIIIAGVIMLLGLIVILKFF